MQSSLRIPRLLRLLAGSSQLIYGTLTALSLVLPIYQFEGSIEGRIALAGYSLFIFGDPLSIDALDRASELSYPLLVFSLISIIIGIYLLASVFRSSLNRNLARASFAVSLAYPSLSALVFLSRVVLVGEAIREIPQSLGGVSSAGALTIPPAIVNSGPAYHLLTPFLSIFPAIITMTLMAALVYLEVYSSGASPGISYIQNNF
ncbi:MAG: hypothetical protein QXT69_05605 [Fervidicoccaceae archaeon]